MNKDLDNIFFYLQIGLEIGFTYLNQSNIIIIF